MYARAPTTGNHNADGSGFPLNSAGTRVKRTAGGLPDRPASCSGRQGIGSVHAPSAPGDPLRGTDWEQDDMSESNRAVHARSNNNTNTGSSGHRDADPPIRTDRKGPLGGHARRVPTCAPQPRWLARRQTGDRRSAGRLPGCAVRPRPRGRHPGHRGRRGQGPRQARGRIVPGRRTDQPGALRLPPRRRGPRPRAGRGHLLGTGRPHGGTRGEPR